MSEMMRAAMLYGPSDLRIEEIPRPEPAPNQALIRIRACGICPSDVRHDFTTALKFMVDGTVRVDPLISHRLPLAKLEEGLGIVGEQRGFKVMIEI